VVRIGVGIRGLVVRVVLGLGAWGFLGWVLPQKTGFWAESSLESCNFNELCPQKSAPGPRAR
jgi:hypothetical protein